LGHLEARRLHELGLFLADLSAYGRIESSESAQLALSVTVNVTPSAADYRRLGWLREYAKLARQPI
jgi:hypothetical protein